MERSVGEDVDVRPPVFEDLAWKRRQAAQGHPEEAKEAVVVEEEGHVPAHRHFRDKYFMGFRKDGEDEPSGTAGDTNHVLT